MSIILEKLTHIYGSAAYAEHEAERCTRSGALYTLMTAVHEAQRARREGIHAFRNTKRSAAHEAERAQRSEDAAGVRVAALEDISLTIEREHWVTIIGQTGSGKSTLAQHLNAILRPTSGRVIVDGIENLPERKREKTDFRELRRKVGLVFQYPEQQLFEETVSEEIAFAPRNWGVPESEISSLCLRSLRLVGLDESYLDRSPFSLSGGEKRRVAIASVLAGSSEYLVLDEPTSGLDRRARASLLRLLDEIHARGTGIILITHDLEIAFSRSDKILILNRGRCALYDTPEKIATELYKHPVPGLVLPEVLQTALMLREKNFRVPITCDPEELAQNIAPKIPRGKPAAAVKDSP